MNKIKIITTIIALCCYFLLSAQTDSLSIDKPLLARHIINLNFPRTRNLNIQMETGFPGNYKIKMPKYDYSEKGTIKHYMSVNVNGNFSLLRKGKFTLAGGASYSYRNIKFSDLSSSTGNIYHGRQEGFHVFGPNATIGYGTLLFGKYVTITGTAFCEFSPGGFELWAGIATATMVLKSSHDEILSVGISGFTHHTSIFPVLPVFVYMRRLSPSYFFDCSLPGYCYIRRLVGRQGRFSTGIDFNSDHFYVHPSTEKNNEAETLYFIKTELKLNAMYEHRLGKHLFFTAKTGYDFSFLSKFYNSDRLMRNALGKYKEHPNFFLNIGVSYNL